MRKDFSGAHWCIPGRGIAAAERHRTQTLRAVPAAYRAEGDAAIEPWRADPLRHYAVHAEDLAKITEVEATHDREALRVEAQARRAEARGGERAPRNRSR